jgi:hypothetical protein
MLIIRQEQMDEFIRTAAKSFEDWMVAHLTEFFPGECRVLGYPEVRATIRYGIEKAERYGITTEREVCKYIDLMYALGQDFDSNPDLPWVQEILQDETLPDPEERMVRLCHMAVQKQSVGVTKDGEQ